MIDILYYIFLILLACFSFVLLFGAPYLPTLKAQQKQALELLDLKDGELLLELGCGDGRMLISAAKTGLNCVGYELNPVLFLIAKFLTFRYRKTIQVEFGDFWRKNWPDTNGVFVFLHPRFMSKLDRKLKIEIQKSSQSNTVKLVSYAFTIPDRPVILEKNALYLYSYNKLDAR
jgi:SAM-dependent methyltransferase